MTDHAKTRLELQSRRSELLRRLSQLEDDLERHGVAPDVGRSASAASAGALIVNEFVASLTREIGLIESALRRIDSREYDCCLHCGGTIEAERLERLPYTVNCEACSAHFPVDYIHQLRSHHSSLRRTVFNVLHVLDDVARQFDEGPEVPRRELAHARALLGDLERHLPIRFEGEERDGYLAEALSAAPRFSRRATELMKEHRHFTARLATLVKELERSRSTHEGWSGTQHSFRQFALDLLAHEQAEADIVESAFLDDLGGID